MGGDDGEPDLAAGALIVRCIELRSRLCGLFAEPEAGATPTIAIADLQQLLADRRRQAIERAAQAGVTIALPPPGG